MFPLFDGTLESIISTISDVYVHHPQVVSELAENVDELKDKKLREKQDILNTRNKLYYKRGNTENESEKGQITKQIIEVTKELDKVKKEIKMCDEVVDNAPKMREQIRHVEKKEQDKVQKKKKRTYEL